MSNLAFDATAKEINFTVTGPTGTTGYLSMFLSEKLISDITDLVIYFDGAEKTYDVTPVEDGWFVELTYLHSTHTVRIVLSSASPTHAPIEPVVIMTVAILTVLVASFTSLALLRKKKITK